MALVVKNPPDNAGDIREAGSIHGSVRSPGGGHGNPLQYFCLENPMDSDWASLVAQTVKRLSAMQETQVRSLGWEDPLEKEMATHSSTLDWKSPWTEEPGRIQFVGLKGVRHD